MDTIERNRAIMAIQKLADDLELLGLSRECVSEWVDSQTKGLAVSIPPDDWKTRQKSIEDNLTWAKRLVVSACVLVAIALVIDVIALVVRYV